MWFARLRHYIDRRRSYRITLPIPLAIQTPTDQYPSLKPTLVNISGTGIGWLGDTKFAANERITLLIRLRPWVILKLPLRVIFCGGNKKYRYWTRAEYMRVGRRDREALETHIFLVQRKRRQHYYV